MTRTRADILLIFDCCYAGNLVSEGRSPYPNRNFEFLAATGGTITPVPGPYSFTSALIWSLEKLVASKVPFSTTELLNQIGNAAPNFPKKQYPILKERYNSSDRRLMLAPIPKEGHAIPSTRNAIAEKQKEVPKEALYLRFYFNKRPCEEQIKKLSKELKEFLDRSATSTLKIGWVGLRSKDIIVREAAMKWRSYRKPSVPLQPSQVTVSPQEIGWYF